MVGGSGLVLGGLIACVGLEKFFPLRLGGLRCLFSLTSGRTALLCSVNYGWIALLFSLYLGRLALLYSALALHGLEWEAGLGWDGMAFLF